MWKQIGLIGVLAAGACWAQKNTLFRSTFESGEEGWIAMGAGAKVHATTTPADVKNGKGSLAYEYDLVPKRFSAAVLPVTEGLAGMRRLRFWIKTDAATPVGVLLSERKPGGGDYLAWFWSKKDRWQQVELKVDDFTLNDGPNDPKDSNGKLDLDQIQGIGLIDLAQIFNAASDVHNLPLVVNRSSGEHAIYLDDFEVLTDGAEKISTGGVTIDDFAPSVPLWMTMGGADLSVSADNPLKERALQADYEGAEDKFVALIKRISNRDLSKARGIDFDIASLKSADVMFTLEMKKPGGQGPRYNFTIAVPGNSERTHRTIAFPDFKLDDNSPAGPERLDPSNIKMLSVIDITAATSGKPDRNTLWIGNLTASGK